MARFDPVSRWRGVSSKKTGGGRNKCDKVQKRRWHPPNAAPSRGRPVAGGPSAPPDGEKARLRTRVEECARPKNARTGEKLSDEGYVA